MASTTRPLRTATYLCRFTEEEKAELERKVRLAAAKGNERLTLADVLRRGAELYLDEFLDRFDREASNVRGERKEASGDGLTAS